jgi:hypothetical protein
MKTRVYINGIMEDEWRRRQMIPRRPMKPEDAPNMSARLLDGLFMREDGAVIDEYGAEYGYRRDDGSVDWVKG